MTIVDQSIGSFLGAVASEEVTPSGGAVAALAGGAGTALCEMVCIHTAGRDGESELVEAGERLHSHREQFLELADEDVEAVEQVRTAFSSTGEKDSTRTRQEALERATTVPLETAETCLAVLEDARVVIAKGNRNAVADAMTGAFLVHAALQASIFTVRSNLELIEDGPFVSETAERAAEIERAADTIRDGEQF